MRICFGLEKTDFQPAIARTLHSAEFPGETGEAFKSFGAIGDGGQAFQFFGEFEDETFLQMGIEFGNAVFGVVGGVLGCQFAETRAALSFPQPLLEAAATPLGNIVFRDRATGEAFVEDEGDLRQRVQPGNEVFAERAIVEAAI